MNCDDPTGKCEEDSLYCDYCDFGPLCEECWDEHTYQCPDPDNPVKAAMG